MIITIILISIIPIGESIFLFQNQLYLSPMTQFFKIISLISITLLVACTTTSINFPYWEEVIILILFFTLSVLFFISANDFLILWLSSEFQTFSLILLMVQNRNSLAAIESAMRVFSYSAFMSNLFLFAIVSIYTHFGTINFSTLGLLIDYDLLHSGHVDLNMITLILFSYFVFKLALAPLHSWLITAAEGSFFLITSFFLIVSKLAAFPAFIRLFLMISPYFGNAYAIITVISLLSIAVGTFGALIQTNIKGFLAYSSISHMGWIILNLAMPSMNALLYCFFYLFVYVFISASFFFLLFIITPVYGSTSLVTLSDFSLIFSLDTSLTISTILILFSSVGLPPFLGFFSKGFVFLNLMEMQAYPTLFLLIVFSAIAAFNYLRILIILLVNREPVTILIMPFSFGKLLIVHLFAILNLTAIVMIPLFFYFLHYMILTSL